MIKYSPSNIRMWSRLGSCGAYGMAMLEIAEMNPDVVACTADLRFYSGLDRFYVKYPDRFYNVGIAEQNLVGIAGGLAKEGANPFVSTYASFATTRALDQVRVNMGYMNLPIKLVGLTAGLSVGILGATHISIEDIAIIRAIPNITVISPADCTEVVKSIVALANYNHPTYIRLTGSMNTPIVYDKDYDFIIGKPIELLKGDDIAIIATGSMVSIALEAAEMLQKKDHIGSRVIDMHTIKPIDEQCICSCMNHDLIVTIEEHNVNGGLGGSVCEVISKYSNMPPVLRIGINDRFPHAGDYGFLLEKCGLTTEMIYQNIIKKIKEI